MAIPSFIFGTEGLAKTPQELAKMRAVADAMRKRRTPQTVGEGIAALGDGIASGLITLQANRAEKSGRESAGNAFSSIMSALSGSGGSSAPSGGGTGVSYSGNIPAADLETDPVNRRVNQGFAAFGDTNAPENWAQIREGIFAGESGGDYDALFGFSNRPGGKFAGTKLTDMTVDEALAFSDPSGPYGQWVKGQVGRVATPMGGYQVVGSTLRSAKEGLGLRGDEKMTPELQEQIGQHIYRTQGTGAWEGYKGPRQPSGQYASLNPSIAPEQPAMDPKTLLAQRLTKMQGQNVSANPYPEVAQAAPQTGVQRVAQAMPQQGGMDQQTLQLIDAMSNPYMSAGQKAVLGAMLDQRMQASDPLRQMQLEKGRLELEQMRNPKAPDSVRALEERARLAGLQRGTPEYAEFITTGGTKGVTVNNNIGEGDKFYENLDKKNAETFAMLSEGGVTARGKLNQIDRLESLLSESPSGMEAGVKQMLGDFGIPTEGLDNIQSTRALLEAMVPQQRPVGSGPMSDADVKMFRNSLPRLINQPGGNELILQTMRGIAQYEAQMGEIADMVADRTIKPSEGRKQIRELENPISAFRETIQGGQKSDISSMTIEQLGKLDTSKMSHEELNAAESRWNELMRQR
jgi:hypothetical protein